MADDDLHQTTMLLTQAQRDALDDLAHSRTQAVRELLAASEADYPPPDEPAPDKPCPECGRPVAMVVAGYAVVVRAVGDGLDYCHAGGATAWLYVHERSSE